MMERQGLGQPSVIADDPSSGASLREKQQTSLEAIRRRCLARSIDMPSPGISSMSAPVLDENGRMLLALTVIGPSGAMDVGWSGAIAREMSEIANRITQALPHRTLTHAI